MGLPRGLLELCGHLGAVLPRGHERPSLQATSLPLTQCPAVLQQPPPRPPDTHCLWRKGQEPSCWCSLCSPPWPPVSCSFLKPCFHFGQDF